MKVITATEAGELLPRAVRDSTHFECRMCAWQDRCWRTQHEQRPNSAMRPPMIDAKQAAAACACRTTGSPTRRCAATYRIPHYLMGGLVRYRHRTVAWAARSTTAAQNNAPVTPTRERPRMIDFNDIAHCPIPRRPSDANAKSR